MSTVYLGQRVVDVYTLAYSYLSVMKRFLRASQHPNLVGVVGCILYAQGISGACHPIIYARVLVTTELGNGGASDGY